MISQILETTTDEDGNVIYLIADTGLLVVDENGEAVNRYDLRTTETFEDLDITARHTVFYYLKLYDEFSYPTLKFYRMSTMILYEGTIRATKLEHYYHVNKQPYLIGTHTDLSQSSTYTNTYSGADRVSGSYDYALAGFAASARIYYTNTKYEEIVIDVTGEAAVDPDGNW